MNRGMSWRAHSDVICALLCFLLPQIFGSLLSAEHVVLLLPQRFLAFQNGGNYCWGEQDESHAIRAITELLERNRQSKMGEPDGKLQPRKDHRYTVDNHFNNPR